MEVTTNSPQETAEFAEKFALTLKPGDIVALYGNLGSGKTQFFKGLAKGLGIKQRVTSPTFIFVKTYKVNNKTINHIDLYRGENIKDFKELGLEEIFEEGAITVIEWADKIKDNLPQKRIDVYIKPLNEKTRGIKIIRN